MVLYVQLYTYICLYIHTVRGYLYPKFRWQLSRRFLHLNYSTVCTCGICTYSLLALQMTTNNITWKINWYSYRDVLLLLCGELDSMSLSCISMHSVVLMYHHFKCKKTHLQMYWNRPPCAESASCDQGLLETETRHAGVLMVK